LVAVNVEEAGAVHLPRRTVPVEREGKRQPASLRPQLLLADIVRPAAAGLADAAAHHQKLDDAAIAHVHVIPMVEPGPEDHHGASPGDLRIGRELARHLDDGLPRHAGDAFRPGGGEGNVVIEVPGDILAADAAVEAVTGAIEVEDGRPPHPAAVGALDLAYR